MTAAHCLQLPDREVDLAGGVVRLATGRELRLTRREICLLRQLLQDPGKPCSHDQLMQACWGYVPERESQALYMAIWRLRRKLEMDPAAPQLLRNDCGEGYLLLLPSVESVGESAAEPAMQPATVSSPCSGPPRDAGDEQLLFPRPVGRCFGWPEPLRRLAESPPASAQINGPVGSGKSRFGAEVMLAWRRAAGAAGADDRLFRRVDLRDCGGEEECMVRVATALHIRCEARTPARRALLAALASWPAVVLLLDQADALPDDAGVFLDAWLESAPSLRLLLARRRPLLSRLLPVLPLGALPAAEARGLLEDRARLALPGCAPERWPAAAVDALTAYLDRLPQALEQAAPRAALLGPVALLHELQAGGGASAPAPLASASPVGRGGRQALALAIAALPDATRRVLQGATVFAGEFDLESAAEVLAPLSAGVPEALMHLVREALLAISTDAQGASRFHLYYTVRRVLRQAAGAASESAGAAEVDAAVPPWEIRRRHAHWFGRAMRQKLRELRGPEPEQAVDWCNRHRRDLEQALAFLEEHQPAGAARLALDLLPCAQEQADPRLELGLIRRALRCARAAAAPELQAEALVELARRHSDSARRRVAERILDLPLVADCRVGKIVLQRLLLKATVAFATRRLERGRRFAEQARDAARRAGRPRQLLAARMRIALCLGGEQRPREALEELESAWIEVRGIADLEKQAQFHLLRAQYLLWMRRGAEGEAALEAALAVCARQPNPYWKPHILGLRGSHLAAAGRAEEARASFLAARTAALRSGRHALLGPLLMQLAELEWISERPGRALQWASEGRLRAGSNLAPAYAARKLEAAVIGDRGEWAEAARVLRKGRAELIAGGETLYVEEADFLLLAVAALSGDRRQLRRELLRRGHHPTRARFPFNRPVAALLRGHLLIYAAAHTARLQRAYRLLERARRQLREAECTPGEDPRRTWFGDCAKGILAHWLQHACHEVADNLRHRPRRERMGALEVGNKAPLRTSATHGEEAAN